MTNEQHAGVLLGLLTLNQSRELLQQLNYADKERLIQIIVHLPVVGEKEIQEVVAHCVELSTGEKLKEEIACQTQLRTLADEKPHVFARYIASLIRKQNDQYINS